MKSLGPRTWVLFTLVTLQFGFSQNARADEVDVSARLKVLQGQNDPAVLVTPNKKVLRIRLSLERDDGKKIHAQIKKPKLHKQSALEWKQEPGKHHYQGELVVVFGANNEAAMPLQFDVEVASGAFAIDMQASDLHLDEQRATVRIGCEVDKLDIEIDGEDGVLAKWSQEQHGSPANTPIDFTWKQKPGPVLRIVVRPTCSNGVHREQHFYPWSYPIEHEEVHFASGSDTIPDDERGKLDSSYKAIAAALKKYGRWGKPSLYIAGHTDTVADKAFNRALSNRRARSIARYFKARGMRVPVFYLGFGEEALLVKTPDNTPEPRNRRAEYIISVNPPEADIAGFDGHWNALK